MERGQESPAAALRRLINGFQVSQAIHTAAALGIADLLTDGARASDDLATETASDPDALYRLLRALASVGVLQEEANRHFSLTAIGEGLRSDAPTSIAGWATFIGQPSYWQVWGALEQSVRTGQNAFRLVHGTDPWTFRSTRPEASAAFDRAMTALTRQVSDAVVTAYDFGRFKRIVDVGGGNGTFLADILRRNLASSGVVFDQPHVVGGAEGMLRAAGVADRCEVVGGSFFEAIPAGGDGYVLKAILHDWDDARCVEILRRCRAAMGEEARLLVIERELGPANAAPEAKFSDLNMLVAPGGRERTAEEFGALFATSGLRMTNVMPTRSVVSIFEAMPA